MEIDPMDIGLPLKVLVFAPGRLPQPMVEAGETVAEQRR